MFLTNSIGSTAVVFCPAGNVVWQELSTLMLLLYGHHTDGFFWRAGRQKHRSTSYAASVVSHPSDAYCRFPFLSKLFHIFPRLLSLRRR